MCGGIFGGDLCCPTLGVYQLFKGGSEGGGAFAAILKCAYLCCGCRGNDMFDYSREN